MKKKHNPEFYPGLRIRVDFTRIRIRPSKKQDPDPTNFLPNIILPLLFSFDMKVDIFDILICSITLANKYHKKSSDRIRPKYPDLQPSFWVIQ